MRRGVFSALVASLLLAGLPLGWAQQAPPAKGDRLDAAAARAVGFLLTQQNEDGSFADRNRRKEHNTVMTAMALMAMASVGHLPGERGPEGDAMRRGVDFLMRPDRQTPDGYFGRTDGSRMYGHGVTTLALSELLGMGADAGQDALLREHCRKAVELILRSQRMRKQETRYEGGWRYTPDSSDADLSVSVWQLMALRSAKDAGLPVPKEAIDAAVAYLKRSYRAGTKEGRPSGFGYTPGETPEYATSAAGLLAMQVSGEYNTAEVTGAADWLFDFTGGRGGKRPSYGHKWFFYGTYYYAQGMQKRGGEHARYGRQFVEQMLLPNQAEDGSWTSGDGQERNAGRVYTTSLAVLSLSTRFNYLPIYQF